MRIGDKIKGLFSVDRAQEEITLPCSEQLGSTISVVRACSVIEPTSVLTSVAGQ